MPSLLHMKVFPIIINLDESWYLIFYRFVDDTHDYFCQRIVVNQFTFSVSLRYATYSQSQHLMMVIFTEPLFWS